MAVQQGNWRNVSDLEMLQMLKDEIIRIGIEDYPSKTKFNELYDSNNVPGASTYLYRFKKTWVEIIEMIGLEYDQTSMRRSIGKLNKGKQFKSKWNVIPKKEIFNMIKDFMNENEITTKAEYDEYRKKLNKQNTLPSTSTVLNKFGKWKDISEKIKNNQDWE